MIARMRGGLVGAATTLCVLLCTAISEGTVKVHMKSILPKLGARDRTHAVMIAVKRGSIDV
jgi:DNA-binding CsgD family transcriptional regulator